MKIRPLLTAFIIILTYNASYAQSLLKTGVWRGVTQTASGVEIPFNFEASTVAKHSQLAIINGNERIKVTDVKYQGDSVFIKMPLFDSEFRLKHAGGKLTGKWIKNLGDKYVAMNFNATPNTPWRFKAPNKPAFNVTGRWAVPFVSDGKTDMTVGEFKQVGSKLTGTFLSTTGDYRYLEGVVSGNKLYLSCFDGGHDYLFTAKINGNRITGGKFYAGLTSIDTWTGVKDPNAKLPDAFSLTALKPGYKKLAFTFKDINGKNVSLTDARYKNKVVIVQILGSWCPNCMDETAYLVNFYKKFHPKGVEVVGLAYERTRDFAKSQRTVRQLKNRFNIPYPILLTGYTPAAGEPAKSLPMMAKVLGFPTTIMIDKKGNVRKIHTGFSGPGTGEHYTDFITEFERLTIHMLEEQGY
ncbi:TlpA disulfide reductase family protein [Mucilaginibacter sp. UR6-11]|uniref:TlpA disulfide reductase family protein n=1 Tax=Mucilaginibacter sp. UR6-11 TaxID=1435644 RepID=UPI001E45B56C|nr:TlpA disulfide reductase family protein [Mucilaginibacter sp. UR6-11]MCC8424658.1 TlpA family protein disulfide reductase [Mucilaginibacter sp. UR6-11]